MCQKLFAEAKESETNGDQEKAFVYFFKYCELAQTEPRSGTRYMDCEESVRCIRSLRKIDQCPYWKV